ncbi:MAG TPA: RNase adapter RapZ [Clostridiales bacterium]|nr:RNase adapter RapZ [Clostridiales bacterium]
MLELKIITGMSGAGKTQLLRIMEDLGYYAVDHLPVELIVDLVKLLNSEERGVKKAAIVVDIRENGHFHSFFSNINRFPEEEVKAEIIFLEAAKEVLLKRFHETRRRHPLGSAIRILSAIEEEEKIMAPVRKIADRKIDTGRMKGNDLAEYARLVYGDSGKPHILVNVVSFGYKYGVPQDADFVFDVRFLPNPFYNEILKPLTGKDSAVGEFIMAAPEAVEFLVKIEDFLTFILSHFEKRTRDNLVIAVGCTGGQHRSVFFAEKITEMVEKAGYFCTVNHSDAWRGGNR